MPTVAAQQDLVLRAKALLSPWNAQAPPVSEVARRLDCSIYHLCRAFRRSEGQTIREYRAHVRLSRAVSRLKEEPDVDLTRLAFECGYCSHSHMTSCFRRRLGMTPSAFAATLLSARGRTPASADPCGTYSR